MSDGEFVDTLAMAVQAYDQWGRRAEMATDDDARRHALQQQRSVAERMGATFAFSRVEVARLLVTMWRALEREELLHRTESRLDCMDMLYRKDDV